MWEVVVYVKCNRNVVCTERDVFMSDIGSVFCEDKRVSARCKAVKIHHFTDRKYMVVTILHVIEKLTTECPGIRVESLGEEEVILEPSFSDAGEKNNSLKKSIWRDVFGKNSYLKIAFVCCICFFGTGFTIMAFQNDIGINNVFARVYRILMGEDAKEITVLQVFYAVGLLLGILLFFNHAGKKKITSDPTPIQVSMKNYEDDVNKTLVQMGEQGGRELDV